MELMMAQQTKLKCEVYDLQKKLEAMKQQTELKCEVADLMKVIRRYQETWVDGALVESEKKAVQDYITELKAEIAQHKQEIEESIEYGGELFRENQKLKYENGELKEEIANLKDEEEEVVEVPAVAEQPAPLDPWRKLENTFHRGNDAHKQTDKKLFRLKVEGLTSAEIITKAKEHCETEVYGGFTINRNKNKVYFHKSIAVARVINKDNALSDGITYTKFGWHDLYINGAGYGAC